MATLGARAQAFASQGSSSWILQFLREELAPYPGRMSEVTRMLIAATLSMLVTMTFRIPEGAYAAIYAFNISRVSPRATIAAAKTVAIVFVIAAAYELVGALLFVSEPVLRVVWLLPTFVLMFYLLSAMTNYTAAMRFGYLVIITTPIWDRHISANDRIESTLWAVLALTLSTGIATLVELIYAEFWRGNELIQPIAERLSCVEQVLLSYADGLSIGERAGKNVARLSMVGMSALRRNLQRSGYSPQYREQMGAVLALVARIVDLAANLAHLRLDIPEVERERMRGLAQNIARIRADFERDDAPRVTDLSKEHERPSSVPLLREMETTVALIPEAFTGCESLKAYAPPESEDAPRATVFRTDALSNFEHIKFALKGGLAASLCYIIYSFIAWPGLSTAVTTCFLTATSTIGSSRQKQVLRIAGAIVGGIVLGMGAQIFILPHLDSITGFTMLFLAVTFIAAWFATCSPRLSYFGLQIAVAFYLINLQEFRIQTSLGIARDRVFGILLGLLMMWLVFDQIWGAPAGAQMKKTFISGLRLLAQFTREPLSKDVTTAMERNFALRETINGTFDQVRALADGVLLEFGPSRGGDIALRDQIRAWQGELRTLFITRTALWKYRMRLPGFKLPDAVVSAQTEFDNEVANTLENMADCLEGNANAPQASSTLGKAFDHLQLTTLITNQASHTPRTAELDTFVMLCSNTEQLITSLSGEFCLNRTA